ncbi:hypothetical protein R1sor_021613 [Riccia sorocarpa]|uniref:Cytochrome P450 n=1 Tax=Riccia sorocarpa TaxID=122646 RepID=A0ABD3GJG1_9MARC
MATMWNGISFPFTEQSYMTLIIILAATVLWLLWSVSSHFRSRNQSDLRLPPGSFGFPFIGQTVEYVLALRTAEGIRQWVQTKIDKHGPLFKWRFTGYPVVMMDQPEGTKFIFQNEGTSNHIFWPPHISTLVGPDCVMGLSGERHKRARRLLARFFDHSAMSRYLHAVNRNAIRHFNDHWQGKEELVVLDMTNKFTFSTICNLLLTVGEGPMMDKFLEECDHWAKSASTMPINLPGFQYHRGLKARNTILEMLDGLLQQRRKEIAEDCVSEASKVDILHSLLTMPEEEGNLLSDSFIKDNLLFLFISGFDTSSGTLAMTIYFIAKYPHVYKEVLQEHKLILEEKRRSGKDENVLTMEDISTMKYTWRVVKETLRLHPVVIGSFRKTAIDLEYKGYNIPKGWLLNWNTQDSHYNPKYFKDPLTFDPSRWERAPIPFTYLPFGGGPHICLGNEFAQMEILVFIHHLVRNYSWSLVNPNYNGPIIRDPLARTPDRVLVKVKQMTAF